MLRLMSNKTLSFRMKLHHQYRKYKILQEILILLPKKRAKENHSMLEMSQLQMKES